MEWRVETLNATVDRELHALPVDLRARFMRICQLMASVGLERVSAPHVKHLNGPQWGMRMSGRSGIARVLYVSAKKKRVGVVRVFVKKTPEDTPPRDRIGAGARRGENEMSKVADLHTKWSEDPEYRKAYDRLGPEFELSRSLIEARTRAKLTQAELAQRMNTTQSVVARLESGRSRPSTRTLEKIAQATRTRVRINFDPA